MLLPSVCATCENILMAVEIDGKFIECTKHFITSLAPDLLVNNKKNIVKGKMLFKFMRFRILIYFFVFL